MSKAYWVTTYRAVKDAEKVAAYCKSNASSTLANALEAVAKK